MPEDKKPRKAIKARELEEGQEFYLDEDASSPDKFDEAREPYWLIGIEYVGYTTIVRLGLDEKPFKIKTAIVADSDVWVEDV